MKKWYLETQPSGARKWWDHDSVYGSKMGHSTHFPHNMGKIKWVVVVQQEFTVVSECVSSVTQACGGSEVWIREAERWLKQLSGWVGRCVHQEMKDSVKEKKRELGNRKKLGPQGEKGTRNRVTHLLFLSLYISKV